MNQLPKRIYATAIPGQSGWMQASTGVARLMPAMLMRGLKAPQIGIYKLVGVMEVTLQKRTVK